MRRLAPYLARVARVSVALGALSVIAMLLLARSVRAQMTDLTVRFGDELSKLPREQGLSGDVSGDAYRVLVNGSTAQISSGSTALGVAEVLSHAFDDCSQHADGMADDFSRLDRAIQPNAARTTKGGPGFSVIKQQVDDDQGFVICFANGRELSTAEALERLRELADTGDLSRIGYLRYVNARKAKDGGTFVYAVWTDSVFNVKTMFPETGDAPGTDPVGVKRPDGARRLFSATVEGAPAALFVYDVPLDPAETLRVYAEMFPKAGYPAISFSETTEVGLVFATQERNFLVQATPAGEGHSNASITESRFRLTK